VRLTRFVVVGAALTGCTFGAPDGVVIDAPPDVSVDAPPDVDTGGRVIDDHLIALWRFNEGTGTLVGDTARTFRPWYTKPPMDLVIESATGSQWIGTDGLQIDGNVTIRSRPGMGARPHMTPDVNGSGAVTLELWVTPADIVQGSPTPATLFSLGSGPSNCSVRITQTGSQYIGCAKTVATARGTEKTIPTPTGSAAAAVQHVVLVADGTTRAVYVDGVPYAAPAADVAPMAGWIENFRISIADEAMGGGPWRGRFWFAAVYDRVLTPEEIRQNLAAGHLCSSC